MKKGEYKLKKQIFRNLYIFWVFILMFSCFFVFGKKVSANENQNAAPIITYYGLNGNDITIQWKAPDGVSYSKVDIYSATSPNGSYRYENTVSGNSYTNTYVAKGVPYYYKLEASYEDNEGYKTVTTYAGKCIINPLPAPSSLEASTGNSHSITVKWKASDDCDGYQIYRSVSPDGNYELVQTVSNESRSSWWYDDDDESFQTYTQKNLELGKIYYYKIRPYTTYIDETFYGDFSNYISCQVTINGTKVKSASSKKKKINTITWAKNDEADGYIVYYSTKEDGNYTKLKTFTSRNNLSYTHTKLTNGTAYYYKIQAYKNFNGGKLYGPMTPYLKYCDYYSYADESYESRCRRAFGKSYYADYKSAKQAKKHMKTITVKVWDKKGKKKYTRKFRITVNKGLAPSIKEMFKEIYKSKERFPIHEIGCYSWRGKNSSSEHCEGLAFDINSNENYMIQGKKVLAGSFWKPKKNRYSIPLNCKLVKILEKYGFNRGLWGSRRDYMHFSYFGG